MPSDFNCVRYVLPKFSKSNYNALMKTIHNTFTFDLSDIAKYRFHILSFFYLHGLKATLDAFKVKKSTFYDWKKAYEFSGKRLSSLIPQSTRPKHLREMTTNWRLEAFIKTFREEYGNLSKEKIKPFLDEYARSLGIASYGATKIGKIIKRRNYFFDGKARCKKRKKPFHPRIKKTPKETKPGYLEMDSLTIYILGQKYYFITIIDIVTKLAWCKLTTSLSGRQAKLALEEFRQKCPYPIHTIQTDNGSEFLGEFHSYLEENQTLHQFIYLRSPKINGVVERFNRTIQDEFINRNDDLAINLVNFNQKMLKYLNWYNYRRPHCSLSLQAPITFINNYFKKET